jgi:two-component system LytT family response regulator
MPKLSILILDDEYSGRAGLKTLLETHATNHINLIDSVANLEAAKQLIQVKHYHIFFLDIKLNEGTGFDLVTAIPEDSKIVYVTAFSKFAIAAIKHKAYDYLLKPVDPLDLIKVVDKCYKEINEKARTYLTIKSNSISIPIELNTIIYLKANGPYSEIYLADHNAYTTSKTLKNLSEKLNGDFIRVHKSFIINKKYITGFNQKNIFLVNNICINLSRTGLELLQSLYAS